MSEEQQKKSVHDSINSLIRATEQQFQFHSISTIHRVPDWLRDTNPGAYDPRIISIGPIHHNARRLKAMETAKGAYMNRLLCRHVSSSCQNLIDECIEGVFQLLEQVRYCYGQSICWAKTENGQDVTCAHQTKDGKNGTCTNKDWAEVMILDGCFILELLYAYQVSDMVPTDPIFGNILVFRDVTHDLLLLENQIPFFLLEVLYQITLGMLRIKANVPNSLSSLVLPFFEKLNIFKFHFSDNPYIVASPHILGLFHSYYVARSGPTKETNPENDSKSLLKRFKQVPYFPKCFKVRQMDKQENKDPYDALRFKQVPYFPKCFKVQRQMDKQENKDPNDALSFKYTAAELARAGINFEPIKGESFILAIEFRKALFLPSLSQWWGRTKLKIPAICVNSFTEPFLRNLIAYEQCTHGVLHCITSFAVLMDHLIDTQEDVDLLIQSKFLENNLSTSENVAAVFNGFCNEVVLSKYLFEDTISQLEQYCKGFFPKNIASLKWNYFSSPWSYITVIAALVLFAITVVQTIYTVHSV